MTETTPPLEASPVLRESISLTERFPNCFNWNRVRPLKIGIHRDLWAILGESHARVEIRRLLSRYCNHARYRHALKEGAVRVDLQGQPAGVVTVEEAEDARTRLQAERLRSEHPKGSGNLLESDRPSDDTLLPEDHLVPGRLELTVKFSELPKPLPVQSGLKIGIQTGEGVVSAILATKVWRKLEQAAQSYPQWVAALSGSLDRIKDGEILLKHPALQVFEKKPKPAVEPTASTPPSPPQGTTAPTPTPTPTPVRAADGIGAKSPALAESSPNSNRTRPTLRLKG